MTNGPTLPVMRRTPVLIAAAALATLAACSSGGGSSPSSTSSSFATPQDIASRLDCTSPVKSDEIMVREAITCDYGSDTLEIVTFNDNGQRDSWKKIASGVGGGVYVVGDKWLVSADSTATATNVQRTVGGKVQ
jgi:hypothetical protein